MSDKTEVSVFGERILVVEGGEPERIRAMARHIDMRREEILSKQGGSLSYARQAAMTVLSLADDFFSAKAERNRAVEEAAEAVFSAKSAEAELKRLNGIEKEVETLRAKVKRLEKARSKRPAPSGKGRTIGKRSRKAKAVS